jgi:hypothetical protein
MTDWTYVSSIVERLQGAVDQLREIFNHPDSEFWERFRRWKERTAQFIERHVSAEEAQSFRAISTSWDELYPESFSGMIDEHGAFLLVLAEEVATRPEATITATPQAPTRPRTMPPARVFISHAASDRPLAEALRDEVLRYLPEAKVFVASRPGHITTGEEWWTRLGSELRAADAYIILLTPDSLHRSWISFETGAAWFSRRPLLMLAHGIQKSDVKMPLMPLQLSYVMDPEELAAAFREIGIELDNPSEIAARLRGIKPTATDLESWQGIDFEGRFFAWDGPGLHGLQDRDPEPTPPGLVDELREAGHTPRYARPDNLERTLERGALIVYETDRQSWRRRLWGLRGEQILVVKPAASEGKEE